jgi:hypothetical protein
MAETDIAEEQCIVKDKVLTPQLKKKISRGLGNREIPTSYQGNPKNKI